MDIAELDRVRQQIAEDIETAMSVLGSPELLYDTVEARDFEVHIRLENGDVYRCVIWKVKDAGGGNDERK